jgi:hypothetical protein
MHHDYRSRVRAIVLAAAEAAKQDMASNVTNGRAEPLQLYVKPCTHTEDGMLRMFPNSVTPPQPWKHTGSAAMGTDIPYENYFTWIHHRSCQLPILAPEYPPGSHVK